MRGMNPSMADEFGVGFVAIVVVIIEDFDIEPRGESAISMRLTNSLRLMCPPERGSL
jgi:hypothetical protein